MCYVTINGNVLKALLMLQAFLMLIPLLIGVKGARPPKSGSWDFGKKRKSGTALVYAAKHGTCTVTNMPEILR